MDVWVRHASSLGGEGMDSEKLQFKVDFPSLYLELTEPANITNIGPGGAMGLRLVLLGLKQIAEIAIAESDRHSEILEVLEMLGIVSLD